MRSLGTAFTKSAVAPSAILTCLLLAGCTGLTDRFTSDEVAPRTTASEIKTQPVTSNSKPNSAVDFLMAPHPKCLEMVQNFCQTLFSAEHQGSLEFDVNQHHYEIRLGEMSNDLKQKDYDYLSAKVQGWWRLPSDLRDALNSRNLLDKIRAHLSHSSRQKMSLAERVRTMRADEEIELSWNSAMHETVLVRMERFFPGYSRYKEDFIPLEIKYEAQRQLKILEAEVARAIWGHHKNWQKVEVRFERVRQAYRETIRAMMDIPENIKKDWLTRLDSIKLMIPGSDPEIESEACTKNESNAYFYTNKNALTVCAGDFNTEEIGQTLAHEIAHALDMDRSRFLFQDNSRLGQGFRQLKNMNCGRQSLKCEEWEKQKAQFASQLQDFDKFEPQLEAHNMCLQDHPVRGPIEDAYLQRIAREQVEIVAADLAERNLFLRLISPRVPLPDGTSQANPIYLNPCGYYLWDNQSYPLDDDASLLLFFTSEYRCSKLTDRDEKFKSAIEVARSMQTEVTKAHLKLQGHFSPNERLNIDGFAAQTSEHFADNLGQHVFAQMLKHDDVDVYRRRARYLVNNAWLCRRPSLQQLYPIEARIQKSFFVEPHSDHAQRQKELMSSDIREALECQQDFEIRECHLN
jgi:hypothetical protein